MYMATFGLIRSIYIKMSEQLSANFINFMKAIDNLFVENETS